MTLLLKSTVVGLSKLSAEPAPSLAEFEALAKLALGKGLESEDGTPVIAREQKITRATFLKYADVNPTLSSWLAHFDDLEDETQQKELAAFCEILMVPPEPRSADYVNGSAEILFLKKPAILSL